MSDNALVDFAVKAAAGIALTYVISDVGVKLYQFFLSDKSKIEKLESELIDMENGIKVKLDGFAIRFNEDHRMLVMCHGLFQQQITSSLMYRSLSFNGKMDMVGVFQRRLRLFLDTAAPVEEGAGQPG